MTRILQIHNRYRERGGEDTVVAAEAELLSQAGHQVRQFQAENPSGKVRSARRLAAAPWNPSAARQVKEVVESFQPDVAHVHNTWYSLTPSVLSTLKASSIPVVMTLHNYRLMCANGQLLRNGKPCELCVGSHPWHGVRYRCYRDSVVSSTAAAATIAWNRSHETWSSSVDLFLVMTEFGRSRGLAAGLPEHRLRVKPHFVRSPGPRPSPTSNSNTVVYVGRLSPEKGLRSFLDAWGRANTGDMRLEIIGDGPERSDLEGRAAPNVRFRGQLSAVDVGRLLLEARALVLPAIWYETFGMTVAEAFAAGTPALVSDIGVLPEMVSALGREWLAAPGDVGSWVSAIERLKDDGLVDSGAQSALATYEERFTPERGLQLLESAYAEVSR